MKGEWRLAWQHARHQASWNLFTNDPGSYDHYCFARPQRTQTPSTGSWGRDAREVVAEREPGKYSCRCPVHEDDQASLSILVRKDGRVIVNCYAGCDWLDIKRELKI
jgi:hypothetical protein